MPRTLLIAAVSARPYVAMARAAGYEVVAIDIFADRDTQAMASQVLRLPYHNGGFEPAAFDQTMATLELQGDMTGFVYGSGFEANAALLQVAASRMPLIGNSAETVLAAKSVPGFFRLLDHLGLPYPETRTEMPARSSGWLSKHAGGSGGTHVRRLAAGNAQHAAEYYQREISGIPVSLLFVADGANATVVGYNRQFTAAFADLPFRYAGLVSHADLPEDCRQILRAAAQGLTQALQLRGLNSVDAVLGEDGNTYIVEVNPRLTASAGLYRLEPGLESALARSLMTLHLDSSAGRPVTVPLDPRPRAQALFYATRAFALPGQMSWPDWVADVPAEGQRFEAGDPVCSVHAEGNTADEAWALAGQRLRAVAEIQYGISAVQDRA